jgi:hypothetical protein
MYLELLSLKRNDLDGALAYWRKYRPRMVGAVATTTLQQLAQLQDDPARLLEAIAKAERK